MISSERKKFGLRKARNGKTTNPKLSALVLVWEGDLSYTSPIRFSDDLIQFIGQKLPRGVADYDPVYLTVSKVPKGWLVQASYMVDDLTVDLWLAKERPTWLKSLDN